MNSNDQIHKLFDVESFLTDITLTIGIRELTYAEFCKQAGISTATWKQIRSGYTFMAFQTMIKIADLFQLSIDAYRYNYNGKR